VENLIIKEFKENFTKMIIKIGLIEDFTKQKKIIIIEQLGENPNEDDLLEKTIQIEGLEKVVKNFINEIDKIKGLENDFMDFIEQKIEKKYEKGEEIKKNVEKVLHWYQKVAKNDYEIAMYQKPEFKKLEFDPYKKFVYRNYTFCIRFVYVFENSVIQFHIFYKDCFLR